MVTAASEAGAVIGTLCNGPQLLAAAQLVKGRKMTGAQGIKPALLLAGADFQDAEPHEVGTLAQSYDDEHSHSHSTATHVTFHSKLFAFFSLPEEL
jgi:hypothetical protein